MEFQNMKKLYMDFKIIKNSERELFLMKSFPWWILAPWGLTSIKNRKDVIPMNKKKLIKTIIDAFIFALISQLINALFKQK